MVQVIIQDRQWDRARPYAELLVELVPDAEEPKQMLKQIKEMLSVSESQ